MLEESSAPLCVDVAQPSIYPEMSLSPARLIFELSEDEVAMQLTLTDFHIYRRIEAGEMLEYACHQRTTKNVRALLVRSRRVRVWVSRTILWQETLQDRMAALERLINVGMVGPPRAVLGHIR